MKAKIWLVGYLVLVAGALGVIGWQVMRIDPFFHYHEPNTEAYYYELDNERSQNDGICKHFEYDALITGTSMTDNFKTSEMDELFGTQSVKVPYSGASYKEINDNLRTALQHNSRLGTIVRGLDMGKFFEKSDLIRTDLGEYPTYLYDDNPLNDVRYLLNRNVVFDRIYPMMMANDAEDFVPGITSFDAYANWMGHNTFGVRDTLARSVLDFTWQGIEGLSEEEKAEMDRSIEQNITSLARAYPDVTFYYFFPPYSALWWQEVVERGTLDRQLEAERYYIEQILECDNIHLFSFNNRTDITTDLNHYKDKWHYASWVNSLILKWMHDDQYRLTKENYQEYLASEYAFYSSFDYDSLYEQEDYEQDYYAEALVHEELSGVAPLRLTQENAEQREGEIRFQFTEAEPYQYLEFRLRSGCGLQGVRICDAEGNCLEERSLDSEDSEQESYQYLQNISDLNGVTELVFYGDMDGTGDLDEVFGGGVITLY